MSETEIVNRRAKIIQLKQLECDLENITEALKEVLDNPNGRYMPLINGFQKTVEQAKQCVEFIIQLVESEENFEFSATYGKNNGD